jgi:hypothetical protein
VPAAGDQVSTEGDQQPPARLGAGALDPATRAGTTGSGSPGTEGGSRPDEKE